LKGRPGSKLYTTAKLTCETARSQAIQGVIRVTGGTFFDSCKRVATGSEGHGGGGEEKKGPLGGRRWLLHCRRRLGVGSGQWKRVVWWFVRYIWWGTDL